MLKILNVLFKFIFYYVVLFGVFIFIFFVFVYVVIFLLIVLFVVYEIGGFWVIFDWDVIVLKERLFV